MQKIIFGIFAHPDDEAFGPSGTLLWLASEGYDVHLVLLTDGEAGLNPDNVADLGATRLEEWQVAARIVPTRQTHALHYPDGGLEHVQLEELDRQVSAIIEATLAGYDQPCELSLMSFEPRGITGHHDHIVASQLTTRLANAFDAHETWYFCLDSSQAPLADTALYEPCAREESYITTRIDAQAHVAEKYRMIDAHVSQRGDGAKVKALGRERLSVECFCIRR